MMTSRPAIGPVKVLVPPGTIVTAEVPEPKPPEFPSIM